MGRTASPVNGAARSIRPPARWSVVLPCWPFPSGDVPRSMSSLFHVRVMRNLGRRKEEQTMQNIERQDVYTRITDKIIASLEQGVRPWIKPWDAEQAAGRIARPLRHNGQPYSGINILMLWAASIEQGFAAPMWMTFKQAQELNAHVKKGEKGSLVVYANTITKTEEDGNGKDVEREIPFMKGYTVFNVEQIDPEGSGDGTNPLHDGKGGRAAYRCPRIAGAFAGMRPGEILGLQRQHVSEDCRAVTIAQRLYRGDIDTPKTRSSKRTVAIPKKTASLMQELDGLGCGRH